jgi:hypothetical protein
MTETKMSDDLDRRTIVIFVAALLCLWFGRFGSDAPESYLTRRGCRAHGFSLVGT